tara:strand:- start:527 stop:760 length:234 start_codon:yes stop_codon:yes gene_type:complete
MMATENTSGSIENPTNPLTYDGLHWSKLMIESRLLKTVDYDKREILYNLLFLLERGDIEVYPDPITGELLYKAKELN